MLSTTCCIYDPLRSRSSLQDPVVHTSSGLLLDICETCCCELAALLALSESSVSWVTWNEEEATEAEAEVSLVSMEAGLGEGGTEGRAEEP